MRLACLGTKVIFIWTKHGRPNIPLDIVGINEVDDEKRNIVWNSKYKSTNTFFFVITELILDKGIVKNIRYIP